MPVLHRLVPLLVKSSQGFADKNTGLATEEGLLIVRSAALLAMMNIACMIVVGLYRYCLTWLEF